MILKLFLIQECCPDSSGITVRFAQECCPEWPGITVRFGQDYAS